MGGGYRLAHGLLCCFDENRSDEEAQELCASRDGRPGLPVPNILYGLCRRKATFEVRSCVQVEMAVLGSPSLIFFMVSVDAKQHLKKLKSCVKVEVAVLGSCP